MAKRSTGLAPVSRVYGSNCRYPQGVSPGWVEEYPWDIEGQYVDITGLPEGAYFLVVTADPDARLPGNPQNPVRRVEPGGGVYREPKEQGDSDARQVTAKAQRQEGS